MAGADSSLLRQLSRNSERYRDPLAVIDWNQLADGGWWLPEPALSLYGLPEYATLSVETRQTLSRYEFANVMYAGLWLESVFVQRVSRRLDPALPRAEYEYFLHEIREEAGHSLMFLKALQSGGLRLPRGTWRSPPLADWLARRASVDGALFWLATVIAEDVPDKFNRYVRGYAGELNPAARQVSALHAADEARHLAAARSRLEHAVDGVAPLPRVALNLVAKLLLKQLAATFYTPPAPFYELAGLTHGRWWQRHARSNPARRDFVRERLAPTLRVLEGYGIRPGVIL